MGCGLVMCMLWMYFSICETHVNSEKDATACQRQSNNLMYLREPHSCTCYNSSVNIFHTLPPSPSPLSAFHYPRSHSTAVNPLCPRNEAAITMCTHFCRSTALIATVGGYMATPTYTPVRNVSDLRHACKSGMGSSHASGGGEVPTMST